MTGLVDKPISFVFSKNQENTTGNFEAKPPIVRWNGGRPTDPSNMEWLRETAKDTPLVEMRKRYDEDGYIFVKGLIPKEVVMDMREHYFTHMRSTGIIAPGTNPRDGIFNTTTSPLAFNSIGAPSYPETTKLQAMAAAHYTPEYLAFLQNSEMHEFVREFMGWNKEVLLARTLLRHSVPHGISSAIHYDKIFLRGGDPANDFLTAWVPIGDIAHDGGGLIYLKNSTDIGRRIEANFTERAQTLPPEDRIRAYNQNMAANGSLGTDAEEFYQGEGKDFRTSRKWMTTDYEAGDVIFHNPYIVHGTTLNEDKLNRIRLSTDLRFYQEGSSLDERWLKVWVPTDGL